LEVVMGWFGKTTCSGAGENKNKWHNNKKKSVPQKKKNRKKRGEGSPWFSATKQAD